MKVLLSIKPEFANKIFSGEKLYEYRKSVFKESVTTIVVYASSPVQRIIGELEIDKILMDTPQRIWNLTSSHSGISKAFFSEYFGGREQAYAIKIAKCNRYPEPINPYEGNKKFFPPQSFRYLSEGDTLGTAPDFMVT